MVFVLARPRAPMDDFLTDNWFRVYIMAHPRAPTDRLLKYNCFTVDILAHLRTSMDLKTFWELQIGIKWQFGASACSNGPAPWMTFTLGFTPWYTRVHQRTCSLNNRLKGLNLGTFAYTNESALWKIIALGFTSWRARAHQRTYSLEGPCFGVCVLAHTRAPANLLFEWHLL